MLRRVIFAGLSTCVLALTLGFSPTAFARPVAPTCRTPQVEERIKDLKSRIVRYEAREAQATFDLAALEKKLENPNARGAHTADDLQQKKDALNDLRARLSKLYDEMNELKALPPCPIQTEFDRRLRERLRTGGRPGVEEGTKERTEEESQERQQIGLGPKTHIGLFIGGAAITSLPTSSTSGFYTGGNLNGTPVGFAFGGSVFRDIATFGNAPGPFGSYVLSGGLVIDYINHAPLTWSGTCGGTACTGTGSMNEFNYIGELKLTTPVSPGNTVNGYIGVGGATLWPSGTPTGTGGPSFQGSATAPAARIGFGLDHQFNDNWSAGVKVGFQFTGSTEYGTSLAGERFHLSRKNETIFGTTLTYTPSDIRLKRDIVLIGRLDDGLGLYRYRYRWSDTVYVGVMAQEVALIHPDAIVRDALDDYLRVDYGRLGLKLMMLPEWDAKNKGQSL